MAKPLSFTEDGTLYGGEFNLVAVGTTRTTTGSTAARAVGRIHTLRLALVTTAVTGTSYTCTIEHAPTPSGTWVSHTAFTAVTGSNSQRKVISGLDRYVRATFTGTFSSITFGLTGESVGGEDTD